MQVPDDVRKLLEECLYPKVVKNISKKWVVQQTPFLNLILLTGLMQRDEIKIKKLKDNSLSLKISAENKNAYHNLERVWLELLIKFLEIQGVVYWEAKWLQVNRSELLLWAKKDITAKLELLYNWLITRNRKVFEMVSALSKIQDNFNNWIDMDIFIEEDIPYTKEVIEKFGLISFCKTKDHGFVRLTPEGWYYSKGIYPSYWYYKSILISADFEVFIPHDYDRHLRCRPSC